MNRRDILLGAFASLLTPQLWAASAQAGPRRLLLIELNGGNDGLNTVVPRADPLYARLRPGLGVDVTTLLPLDRGMGLNPAMQTLHASFERGELAVVQGLGYAHPSRSHFRSIEIWDTATDSTIVGKRGWLAGIDPDALFGVRFPSPGIVIGRNPAPLSGGAHQPVVMADSERFAAQARSLRETGLVTRNAALNHIVSVQGEIRTAAATLGSGRPRPQGDFPATPFGRDAAEAAALLGGDPVAPIVKIALSGFDTHANQRARHDQLLTQLARTLAALRSAFVDYGIWNEVLIVTYSEFGRRAAENGSGGTDHGKAAPHFAFGGRVHGGLYGETPQLEALEDGDIAASLDFRCLYNTVLTRWWNAGNVAIEPARFPALSLV